MMAIMSEMTSTLRILEPYPGIFAYYDGRVPGKRLHAKTANWLDDGAYSLGVASYAIVDQGEALVYDTHISLSHAKAIRTHLEGLGVKKIRVVLSHWHKDHIAGNAIFSDCEIIALTLTAEKLKENREKIESADPPISPLIMPTTLFDGQFDLTVGRRRIELHHFAIHSADGNVIWLPQERLLLAGDTLEDTVTYISEAAEIGTHIGELARMASWPIAKILPAHGDAERIAAGGYGSDLIDANRAYLRRMAGAIAAGQDIDPSLKSLVAEEIASGAVLHFAPYEEVHASNIAAVKAALQH
ncbi:Putative bifunctional enzyme HhdD isomerase + cyclase/dehydrase [Neorhizobium galegae bv. orientalis str. HAMBI 540]|uniref:Putative bifunctional enzyme HhdD isomerase + cyclase/dehydrase n=2 Tax=Neorhizobium galegae TaxID=399 RepID=A0A068SWJ0_NEOGA|nr:Putative bifunctional enzyme HhdD isomerase + cyclase/dehydrase [Neorhizobium galegae bv. orientalis str. HAMBI 540]